MAINLANVNLTIDQFQRISDGKFNAGEIRLTSETSIEKINNHVRKTWLNKESISHAEVIAIKQAFVKALQQGGVGDDALRRVREQLGLSPEKAVDTKLNERSLKPLSRQQIREILDENAAAINETVGEGTVRTSDEIYADVEAKTRQTRATKRDETNAELATRRTVTTQRRFSLFQSLVAGDVDYHSEDDRAELLKMAKEALGIVLQLSGGHPREDVAARLAWGTNENKRFTMETGMDEATFARKLEDIIVRLSGNRHADPATFALRDAFRAVPRAERNQWIDELVDGGQRVDYKSRILCIALLQDAGVDDYDSLSLPNRLSGVAATALLRNLSALPEGASAEQARQCLAMARDLPGEADGESAYVPATSTAAYNRGVAKAFVDDNGLLFGAFKTLADDILADVRAVFGPEIVKENAEIDTFVRSAGLEGLLAAQGEDVRATPETLRNALLAAARATAAREAIEARVAARAGALGLNLTVPLMAVNCLMLHNPDIKGRFAACRNQADVAAALDSIQDQIDVEVRRASAVESCKERLGDMARAALSAKTNIPVSALGGNVLSSELFLQLNGRLAMKIAQRQIPSETTEQIEQAFLAEAERFAVERAALLEKAEKLPLSDSAKADLKEFLLAQEKVDYLDLDAILKESEKFDLAPLAAALREGRSTTDIYNAMRPFVQNIDASVQALLAGKVREIGSPERTNVSSILLIAALDRHPGIRIDLGAFFARPDVVADDGNRLDQTHVCFPSSAFVSFGTPPPAEAKAELARLIGAGTPPPVFAQALARAVKAEGIRYPVPNSEEGRSLSSEEAVAVFSAETKLGKALAEILESFPDELTPNALELLARSALRHRGVGNVAEMVDSIRELQPGRPAELP